MRIGRWVGRWRPATVAGALTTVLVVTACAGLGNGTAGGQAAVSAQAALTARAAASPQASPSARAAASTPRPPAPAPAPAAPVPPPSGAAGSKPRLVTFVNKTRQTI